MPLLFCTACANSARTSRGQYGDSKHKPRVTLHVLSDTRGQHLYHTLYCTVGVNTTPTELQGGKQHILGQ